MANYVIVDPVIGAPSPASQTDTTQRWALGLEVRGTDAQSGTAQLGGGVFVYVKGYSANQPQSAGQLVQFVGNNSVQLAGTVNTASNMPVGLACGAISASNVYGWVQVQGLADNARISNHDVAVGASAYVASTTGLVATTQGAVGARVVGMYFPVSATSTQSLSVTVSLNRPTMLGVTANN